MKGYRVKGMLLALALLFLPAVGCALRANGVADKVEMHASTVGLPEDAVYQVYAAPYEDAWRGANGRASVSMAEPFWLLGEVETEGLWWLIEYEVSDDARRIGWICVNPDWESEPVIPSAQWLMDYEEQLESGEIVWTWTEEGEAAREAHIQRIEQQEKDREAAWEARFDRDGRVFDCPWRLKISGEAELARVTTNTILTDDPHDSQRVMRKLKRGETVRVLWEVHSEAKGQSWSYVLTEVDGQKACGFMPKEAWKSIYPAHLEEGLTLVIEEGVTHLGDTYESIDASGNNLFREGPEWGVDGFGAVHYLLDWYELQNMSEALLDPVDRDDYSWHIQEMVREVRLPKTLLALGEDALWELTLDRLVIPEGTERFRGLGCLYNMDIGTLYLPSTLKEFEACIYNTRVVAYEVDKRNPYLKSGDGVLFTADGKKLLAYPNGSPALHYDVPKGVEEIGRGAFPGFGMYDYLFWEPIALTTLNLPMGLRKIGQGALNGCENLISLSIPLTVRECPEDLVLGLARLESFSAPAWLNIQFEGKDPDVLYKGDNGPAIQEEANRWYGW